MSTTVLVSGPMVIAAIAIVAFEWPPMTFLLVTPWLLFGFLVAMLSDYRRVNARQIADAYLRAAYCASCGHDLAGSELSRKGIATCSECGSRWRLPNDAGTVYVREPGVNG